MQNTLYEFLVLHKSVSLPGIGTVSVRRHPSELDISNRQFSPPSFYYSLDSGSDKPSKKLFEWLSASRNISEWDAIKFVNDFSFSLKNKLSESGEANWENVGVLRRDNTGNVKLDNMSGTPQSELPVHAEKVIREKYEHTVLVGEKERSSVEMEEYFAEAPRKRNYMWIIAVVLTLLAIMFIGWYFSEKGFTPSSTGNKSILKSN